MPRLGLRQYERRACGSRRDIGPIGTAARLLVGLLLVGLIVSDQLVTLGHLTSAVWALGLLGFPEFVLVWHWWRVRRHPERFHDTGLLSFLLSLALPLALYFIGWSVPPLWFRSSATLLFVGSSMVLAALRGYAGCEFLALSGLVPAPFSRLLTPWSSEALASEYAWSKALAP